MKKIAYIATENKTNLLIAEHLLSTYPFYIDFISSTVFENEFEKFDSSDYDLGIIDLNTLSGNALKNIEKARETFKDIPLLALHVYEKTNLIQPILSAGANGFLSISPTENQINSAITALLNGDEFNPYSD